MTALSFRAALMAGTLALATGPAAAQQAEFRGGGYLSDAQNCEAQGWSGVIQFNARYRPIGRPGDPGASLSMYFGTYAANYRFPEDFVFGVFVDATAFGGVGETAFVYLPDPPPQVRAELASTITTLGEEELHGILEFRNFNGLPGCSIRGEIWMRVLP